MNAALRVLLLVLKLTVVGWSQNLVPTVSGCHVPRVNLIISKVSTISFTEQNTSARLISIILGMKRIINQRQDERTVDPEV